MDYPGWSVSFLVRETPTDHAGCNTRESEMALSKQDSEITRSELLTLQKRTAQGLRRAAWKILLAVAIICGNALILSSGMFEELGDAAATLTWAALVIVMIGTGVAAYFFFKAQQVGSTRL